MVAEVVGVSGVDPWSYQCGKCGRDFKTKAERDQHMIGCGQEPKPNCKTRSSSPEHYMYI